MKARNGQTQDNRSSNQSMTKNWVADASPWKGPRFQEGFIIIRRGQWDQPERLRCWDRSKQGVDHRERPESVRTVEGYSQHGLSQDPMRVKRTLVPSGSGIVRLYFLCSSSRRIRVLDPGSSASRGSSRSVILTVRHETTSLFPWKLTCMSSFFTRGKSKMAVTVSPSADSRYFTLE